MSIIPNAYLRNERLASANYEGKVMEGLVKARAAIEVAKNAVREVVIDHLQSADHLVNNELTNVEATARRSRAFILRDEQDSLLEEIMRAIDDHYFLPINLMSKEAGEE